MEELHRRFQHCIALAFSVEVETSSKKEAEAYLFQLQKSPEAWSLLSLILPTECNSDDRKLYEVYWGFQLITDYFENFVSLYGEKQGESVYENLRHWTWNNLARSTKPFFLRGKCAQALAECIYVITGAQFRVNFFNDLLRLLHMDSTQSSQLADMFLRVLQQIEGKLMESNPAEDHIFQRMRQLRYHIKEAFTKKLVEEFFQLISPSREYSLELSRMGLETLNIYIRLLDPNLFMRDSWINLLYDRLQQRELQAATLKCLKSIVERKMDIDMKNQLISRFRFVEFVQVLVESYRIKDRVSFDVLEENSFLEVISEFLSSLGLQCCEVFKQVRSQECEKLSAKVFDASVQWLPCTRSAMHHLTLFIRTYLISLHKRTMCLSSEEKTRLINNLIMELCRCIVLPENPPLDIEAYHKYRHELCGVLQTVSNTFPLEGLSYSKKIIESSALTFAAENSCPTAEALLRVVFELTPKKKSESSHFLERCDVFRCLVEIPFLSHRSPLVHWTYFELVEHYSLCLKNDSLMTKKVLTAFFGTHHGVQHISVDLRKRISQIFSKISGLLHEQLASYSNELQSFVWEMYRIKTSNAGPSKNVAIPAERMQPTSPITSPTPRPVDIDHWYIPFDMPKYAPHEDITFLFEGLLVLYQALNHDEKTILKLIETIDLTSQQNSGTCEEITVKLAALIGIVRPLNHAHFLKLQIPIHRTSQGLFQPPILPQLRDRSHWVLRDLALSYFQHLLNGSKQIVADIVGQFLEVIMPLADLFELQRCLRLMIRFLQLTDRFSPVFYLLEGLTTQLREWIPCDCTDPKNMIRREENQVALEVLRLYCQMLLQLFNTEKNALKLSPIVSEIIYAGVVTHPRYELNQPALRVLSEIIRYELALPYAELLNVLFAQIFAPYMELNATCGVEALREIISVLDQLMARGMKEEEHSREISAALSSLLPNEVVERIKQISAGSNPSALCTELVRYLKKRQVSG